MSQIPVNRYAQAKGLCANSQETPVVVGVPAPARQDFTDKILIGRLRSFAKELNDLADKEEAKLKV